MALDGSELAAAALPEAARLARLLGGELVLLRVVPLLASLPPPGAAAWDVSAVDRLQVEAWRDLRAMWPGVVRVSTRASAAWVCVWECRPTRSSARLATSVQDW